MVQAFHQSIGMTRLSCRGETTQSSSAWWECARHTHREACCEFAQARTQTENWCGVLQEVALPGTGADPARFMEAAVKFANERCWGSLSCSMMACPRTNILLAFLLSKIAM